MKYDESERPGFPDFPLSFFLCRFRPGLAGVVDAGAVGLVTGQQAGGSYVSRVFGIGLHVGHAVDGSGEHYIPALGGIFVDTHFDAAEHVDNGGQFEQGVFESGGHLFAFLGCAGEFESDNVFYHNRISCL